MKTVPIVISDRIRLPKKYIPTKDIKKRYVIELYDESNCATCTNRPDRGPENEICQGCKSFMGVHRFYNSAEAKEGVWSLPQADLLGVKTYLRSKGLDFKIKDKRKEKKFKHDIKFTGKLFGKGDIDDEGFKRANQKFAIKQWMKHKTGIVVAKARSGKTVLSTYSYCKLGVRTVIVANQRELLNQFYETATGKAPPKYLHGKFVDSDVKAGRKAMTNIAILEEETGQKIIFLPKNFAQLETFIKKHGPPDVLLVPYQSFMHDASRVHNVINKYYSMVIVDEEHGTGATQYLAFIARLNLLYRMGLTATPHRKDGKSKLSARVMGPVVAQISGASIQPKIIFYPVKAKPTSKHKTWTGAEAWLKRSKDRNIEIVQQVFSDLRSGDNVIIIPVNHKDHQDALVKMINKQAEFNARERGENWPVKLARPFHADVDRQKTLAWVDSYDKKGRVSKKLPTNSPRVIVAIRSMIQQGIDMKRPSMVYLIIPMSGKYYVGAPMAYQLFCRVATPYRDKPEAKVKIFVDNVPFFAKCIQSLLFNEILPKSNLKKEKDFDYKLDSATYAQAKSLLNARSDSRSRKTVKWWE